MNLFKGVCTALLVVCMASSAFATDLKVRGNLDIYGMWSANLNDFDSDSSDPDHYTTTQRMRVYFDYIANENLKAVLGFEIDTDWGVGDADWGTDLNTGDELVYMKFQLPDTKIGVTAGLQPILLPGIFGNPMFFDDAPAFVVSSPINDVFGLTVGYTRGIDGSTSFDGSGDDGDDMDMVFVVAPVKADGFSLTPYAGYVMIGENVSFAGHQSLSTAARASLTGNGEADVWYMGGNAKVTMFDPITLQMDLIYGEGENDDYETKGFYAAAAASYQFDALTATLFGTYASGADDDADEDNFLPALAQCWMLSPYLGGSRAFSTGYSNKGYATGAAGVGADGTGLWTAGLILDKISFVDSLSHKLMIVYGKGTSDEDAGKGFDEEDSIFEMYLVNKYAIYENLSAINEIGYATLDGDGWDDSDSSYFMSFGFQYKF
jgi:hypothetical protein